MTYVTHVCRDFSSLLQNNDLNTSSRHFLSHPYRFDIPSHLSHLIRRNMPQCAKEGIHIFRPEHPEGGKMMTGRGNLQLNLGSEPRLCQM